MKTPNQKKRWIQVFLLGMMVLISFSFLFVLAENDQRESIGLCSISTIETIKIEHNETEKKKETEVKNDGNIEKETTESTIDDVQETQVKKDTESKETASSPSPSKKENNTNQSKNENTTPEETPVAKPDEKSYATISIDMINILDHKAEIEPRYQGFIPENGIVLNATKVEIQEGDTVYSILNRVCKENGIALNASNGYVRYINQIGEFDVGKSSGWLFKVNGQLPSIGSSSYKINENDVIEWRFTVQVGDV